ncbi:hypothetical protein A2697_02225 [Candidatus Curtissbacteria bacterium RIFCSPHIGHO2_01_FULL_41_44]|uniref:ATP phosphoribosyltransferase n=1 Tax=Candidatus Curtissbacteria bacterium RIFCSPLOWO2_01_FULL_42_50 TaxID=1797730 RepID=A0A1F5H3Y7_9BACT|nr:MAG: hypothetical protein A2697_02225 [Candidatus Curtissbacteria bacterium RIFCSPHIGHO2_01_FULL_41_44]OGD94460.1 MAG: hypothetical protein A3C33_03775 [Candidatus Curtissbacteria bacterium RIFCSPHIGHO2_02_FULL_42_58]OGD97535.1 MAG: hypothetical protein A3E71_00045 [Candidatus Curtissbacteria bacterium RIFCSPHIGHO2_12_FULL_42_33]OGD98757.1 MAG: hypothetical protein A3B54_04935 [Candidatus Curtissbacteria bacterium RIFCSPLOWO2_01_FULL_42_50]OGE03774.1 MAG: hypothetical protein A3G16_04855 [Ca
MPETLLKFIIPQNQPTTREHMALAGWEPTFMRSHSRADSSQAANELNIGIVRLRHTENKFGIIQVRSLAIPEAIADGRYDVGLVGSDCVAEKPSTRFEVRAQFSYGRVWDSLPPRLEFIAHPDSSLGSIQDLQPGSIVMTERPLVTKSYLEEKIHHPVLISDLGEDLVDFRARLHEAGSVGINVVPGSVPALVEPDGYYGVLVNETGGTARDYGLKVIAKIMDIQTLLIANIHTLQDAGKRELICRFQQDLEGSWQDIERESRQLRGGPERSFY